MGQPRTEISHVDGQQSTSLRRGLVWYLSRVTQRRLSPGDIVEELMPNGVQQQNEKHLDCNGLEIAIKLRHSVIDEDGPRPSGAVVWAVPARLAWSVAALPCPTKVRFVNDHGRSKCW